MKTILVNNGTGTDYSPLGKTGYGDRFGLGRVASDSRWRFEINLPARSTVAAKRRGPFLYRLY